jgi:hypothetical protein
VLIGAKVGRTEFIHAQIGIAEQAENDHIAISELMQFHTGRRFAILTGNREHGCHARIVQDLRYDVSCFFALAKHACAMIVNQVCDEVDRLASSKCMFGGLALARFAEYIGELPFRQPASVLVKSARVPVRDHHATLRYKSPNRLCLRRRQRARMRQNKNAVPAAQQLAFFHLTIGNKLVLEARVLDGATPGFAQPQEVVVGPLRSCATHRPGSATRSGFQHPLDAQARL